MESKKTHSLKIRGHIFFVDMAYASHIYKILGSESDLIEIKNDEKKMYMKVYKREVCLVPLDDMEIIIRNSHISEKLEKFISIRKEQGIMTTPTQIKEYIIKEKKGEPHR